MSAGGVARGGGAGSGRYLAAFSAGLKDCSRQVEAYGSCIRQVLPEVERGVCETEFQALSRCFYPAVRKHLAAKR